MASMFLKEEKTFYKMVYYALYLTEANCQKSCYSVVHRNY